MSPIEIKILHRALVLPPGSLLLLGAIGILLWNRRPGLGFLFCVLSLLGFWALSTPIVADALARSAEQYPALDLKSFNTAGSGAQAIVILGGGVRRDAPDYGADEPNAATTMRLIEGARVARATHLPILVTGGPEEAPAMRSLLEDDLQVPVKWVEAASLDTRNNAQYSAAILGAQHITRIILVTSATHMARSVAEFEAVGMDPIAAPAQISTPDFRGILAFIPEQESLDRSYAAAYEWIGRLARGRLFTH
jgi:uncharacterized SAM-binding protein YcdF (DUF218 family)